MNITKTLSLMVGFTLAADVAVADVFTIAGFTFDDDNSVSTAAVVEGNPNLRIHSAPLFAGRGDLGAFVTSGGPEPMLTFQREKSIGRLLGGNSKRRTASNLSLFVSLPDKKDGPPFANVDRSTIELTWSGKGLRNKPGADFVVYEVGKYEGFAVSVKRSDSEVFTPPRYQFPSKFNRDNNTTSISFDLSSFGLAEGEMITAIRIRNLFNSEARLGADKVDDASGQGGVLYPGDTGYDTAHVLTARLIGSGLEAANLGGEDSRTVPADEGGGREFSTDSLDADIVFVVGLHDIEQLRDTGKLAEK